MAFKLTFLLCAAIFATMYFAGPRTDATDELADAAPDTGIETVAVEADVAAEPAVVPEPPAAADAAAADAGPATTGDGGAAPETAGAGSLAALPAPEPLPEEDTQAEAVARAAAASASLSRLSLDAMALQEDDAAAVSLADRVRAQLEASAKPDILTAAPAPATEPAALSETATLAGSLAEPSATAARLAVVTGQRVNLRDGPSTGDPVVGQVSAGDEIMVFGEATPGWSTIRHPATGETAFMSSNFLTPAAQ